METITVITTGGTIGSILTSTSVALDESGSRLTQEIASAKEKLGLTVNVVSPLNKNSEDIYPSDWVKILEAVKSASDGECSGIVVTHGTDTLPYTASAVLAFNHFWSKKICFTASYHAPDHPFSDTSLSLLAALEFAAAPHPATGVYVAFRANKFNSEAKIMHGVSLKSMVFDDLVFDPSYDEITCMYSPKYGLSAEISMTPYNFPHLDVSGIPTMQNVAAATKKVGMIKLYPGIDLSQLEAAIEHRDILIVEMYHSGTGPSDVSNSPLLRFIKKHSSVSQILMGTVPLRYIGKPYESTLKLRSAGATIYRDLQPHFLYTYAVLGLASGLLPNDVVRYFLPYVV